MSGGQARSDRLASRFWGCSRRLKAERMPSNVKASKSSKVESLNLLQHQTHWSSSGHLLRYRDIAIEAAE